MCYWRNLRKASSNFGRLSGIKQVPKLQTKEKTHRFTKTAESYYYINTIIN